MIANNLLGTMVPSYEMLSITPPNDFIAAPE